MRNSIRLVVALAACTLLVTFAQAQQPKAEAFDAELAAPATGASATIKTPGVDFACAASHCRGSGVSKDPLGVCKSLAKQAGALKSFSAAGRAIDVRSCNAATPAVAAVPQKDTQVKVPPPQSKGAAAASTPKPSAPPASKSTAAAGSRFAFTAPAMKLKGTGVAGELPPFTPLAWDAHALTVTGTGGSAPSTPFTAITITTEPMRVTGAP